MPGMEDESGERSVITQMLRRENLMSGLLLFFSLSEFVLIPPSAVFEMTVLCGG